MSILGDRLAELTARPACQVCAFLDTLDKADRADLEVILDAEGKGRVGGQRLARALDGLPGAPTRNSIDRHRLGHV